MLSKEENELLTRTGPGTPMGELLRRYWMPALLSSEIREPDSAPVQVKMLGEDLVAFRDTQGRVGLLAEHCSHRGTSLFYGRNEECGLRCIYHGWKFDITGAVVETPAEPPESTLKNKVRHPAYPCKELAGMVFTYMGPPQKMPVLPEYEWTRLPAEQISVIKSLQDCNYLQGLEGDCDSAHLSYLHSELGTDLYRKDGHPRLEAEETDFGVRMISTRQVDLDKDYVRITNLIAPSTGHVSARTNLLHTWVPLDDTHTWEYHLMFNRDRPMRDDEKILGEIAEGFRRIRNQDNDYLQDRAAQSTSSFSGLVASSPLNSFIVQDSCVTESMGPIFDRRKEHLGASDTTVIAIRRFLLKAVKAVQEGKDPPGIIRDPEKALRRIVSTGAVMPRGKGRDLLVEG